MIHELLVRANEFEEIEGKIANAGELESMESTLVHSKVMMRRSRLASKLSTIIILELLLNVTLYHHERGPRLSAPSTRQVT